MKTAFRIFADDIKAIARNPIALIITLALLVLPGLYAWYCILANWDPYANTGNVPIVVVNEDEGARSELTGAVNIGEQVTEKLADNDSIDWIIMNDREEAQVYTDFGAAYAMIVLPEDLSRNVVGIFEGSNAQPQILYYPNQRFNAVATKVTDSAAQTLTREVNQAFSSTVNEKLVAAVEAGAASAEQGADRARSSLHGEVADVQEGIDTVLASLDDAVSSIEGWRGAVAGAQNALAAAAEQLPAISRSLATGSASLDDLQKDTARFEADFSSTLTGADQLIAKLSARAAAQTGTASADLSQVAGGVKGASAQLESLSETVLPELAQLAADAGLDDLKAQIDELSVAIDSALSHLGALSGEIDAALGTADKKMQSLDAHVQKATAGIEEASGIFTTQVMPQISSGTHSLSMALAGLSGAIGQFTPQIDELQEVLASTDDALERALDAISKAEALLASISGNLRDTLTDLDALQSAMELKSISELLGVDPENVGAFLSSPVNIVTEEVYPVSNYGTAVAPFYTNLALWVGCFILISIFRLEIERKRSRGATATQRYFGRWLTLMVLALLQSQVICGVDIALGIDCANPAAFMAAGALFAFAYMNIIFALVITLRNIGKTLAILLLIMQVPGSSGMYPIEMMPGFFQAIHPLLPFTYGIDAMREALCGMYGAQYLTDLIAVPLVVALALLIGLLLRPRLMNLTVLFDRELAKTGFFTGEEHGREAETNTVRRLMRAFRADEAYRAGAEARARRFNQIYPRLKRIGIIAFFAIPAAVLIVMLPINLVFNVPTDVKLNVTMLMVILLIAAQFAMILLEYTYRTIQEESRLMGSPAPGGGPQGAKAAAGEGEGEGAGSERAGNAAVARESAAGESADDVADDVEDAAENEAAGANTVGGYIPASIGTKAHTVPAAAAAAAAATAAADDPDPDAADEEKPRLRRFGAIREIFRTDMRLGLRSVTCAAVLVLLVLTPSLYAWFNIAGSWDPYSSTSGLRVAVANTDAGYKSDLVPVTINIGDQVVSQLRANDSFDWQFVSEANAVAGIESGDYYASIVIPSDFSRSMMTYLTARADHPDVIYYTNEKENPIAPLITQKGADSIQESIRATFAQEIDEVGLSLAGELMDYADGASLGTYAEKLSDHLDDAIRDMRSGGTELHLISDLSSTASGIVSTTGAALNGVMAATDAGVGSLGGLRDGMKSADAAFTQAADLLHKALGDGSGSLDELAADIDAALAGLQEAAVDAPEALSDASRNAGEWAERTKDLRASIEDYRDALDPADPSYAADYAELTSVIEQLDSAAKSLGDIRDGLATAADNATGSAASIGEARAEVKQLIADAKKGLADASTFFDTDVTASLEKLKASLTEAADSTDAVFDGIKDALGGLASSTSGLSGQLNTLSEQLAGAGDKLEASAADLRSAKDRLARALASGDVEQIRSLLADIDAAQMATRLATPVKEEMRPLYPVANYGSSMAPFYTVLSLWVGALVMVSTMKARLAPERVEELRRRFRLKPRHEYLGRYGIFGMVGLAQSLLVCLGDLCLLHIQCVHPVLFVLMGVFIGQAFTLIVYTLTELFGDVGKAVCVILLIMQVAASGGTFPIEMLDPFFQVIAPYLPFYHGMTALQGCIAGIAYGDSFMYLAFLLIYVAAMIIIGAFARRPFRAITTRLEHQLEKTDFM